MTRRAGVPIVGQGPSFALNAPGSVIGTVILVIGIVITVVGVILAVYLKRRAKDGAK